MQIRDDPEKGLHNVRSFSSVCSFYGRHIHNFTCSSAPLIDLLKKTNPWRWTKKMEACFEKLKKTMQAAESGSCWSIMDGFLNPVPASDVDQVVLKELMVEK